MKTRNVFRSIMMILTFAYRWLSQVGDGESSQQHGRPGKGPRIGTDGWMGSPFNPHVRSARPPTQSDPNSRHVIHVYWVQTVDENDPPRHHL